MSVRQAVGGSYQYNHPYYGEQDYFHRDRETGMVHMRTGARGLHVTEDFVVGLQGGLEEEVGDAAGVVMYRAGYEWGLQDMKAFEGRFEREFGGRMKMSEHNIIFALEQWWWPLTAEGWGTWMRTCAASLMPGGEAVLHRGFRAVLGVIVELKMDKGLWDAVGKSLAKNAAVLPKGAKDKLVPVLDRGASFLHVAGDYAATLGAITGGAADAVLAKFPPLGTRVIGARGLLVEVFETFLIEAALGILPGGDKSFASAMGELVDRLLDGRLQGPEIAEGFDALRKLATKQLDSASRTALGPLLDKGAAALVMAGELAAEEGFLLSDAVSQLVSRHTLFAENLPNFSSQMTAELRRVLRLAVLQSVPGGDWLASTTLGGMGTRLARLRFKAAIARDAGELLVAGLNRLVRTHPFAKATVKTVQQMGESLALLVEVAENEDTILRASMDRLVAKHGQKADHLREGRGRKTAMNDERMILRSCARALLPGGEEHHREVLDMERIAIERYNIDKALVREALTILNDTVKEYVKAPSAAELRNHIQKSAAYVAG